MRKKTNSQLALGRLADHRRNRCWNRLGSERSGVRRRRLTTSADGGLMARASIDV
jgi:hypothetical protein